MPTTYEVLRRLAEPVLPVLSARVRRDLRTLLRASPAARPQLLDVGGRRSPYTIGLAADVTILDVPPADAIQRQLDLGVTEKTAETVTRRRSNIVDLRLEDMTRSTLPDGSFDAAVSVEVVEHVEDDATFIRQIARVLRPGGFVYLTTPNGDYRRNEGSDHNPDHVRHYTRAQLRALLDPAFERVRVIYAVQMGPNWREGLKSFRARRPLRTLRTMLGNLLNRLESRGVDETSQRTAHLIALGFKRVDGIANGGSSPETDR
ncbi:MAG: methyltransferase domain-containing protein [Acidobacteriota bacterium]